MKSQIYIYLQKEYNTSSNVFYLLYYLFYFNLYYYNFTTLAPSSANL